LLLLAVLIGLPFLRVSGESALRFDVPTLRLLFFGTAIWMQDFFIVLVALIFLAFFIVFATTVLGRVWCGWFCPQTVLVDATAFVEAARQRGYAALTGASFAGVLVSAVIAASLIGYFVSPYELPALLRSGGTAARIVTWSWTALAVILFLDLILLRRVFCATVCPYAKMQGVLFDDRTLVVAFDERRAGECGQCRACVAACPVGIDIRQGLQMACIHCAECVDACSRQMARRGKRSLVGYFFGLPGKQGSGVRVNPLLTGALCAISLLFLLLLAFTSVPFDMSARLRDPAKPAVLSKDGVTDAYTLSLRNRGQADLALELSASSPAGTARVEPDTVLLRKGTGITDLPVRISFTAAPGFQQQSATVTLSLRAKPSGRSIEKRISVILPRNR